MAIVVNIITNPSERVGEASQGLNSAPTPTPTAIPEPDKQALAATYCDTHKDTMHLPDFTKTGYPAIQTKDWYSRTYESGGNLTQEDCYGVIDALETKSNEDYETIKKIADVKIWVGMLPFEAYLSVGVPNDVNNTTTQYGINEQWVYGTGVDNAYLYFEGSDKDSLTLQSWQNF